MIIPFPSSPPLLQCKTVYETTYETKWETTYETKWETTYTKKCHQTWEKKCKTTGWGDQVRLGLHV